MKQMPYQQSFRKEPEQVAMETQVVNVSGRPFEVKKDLWAVMKKGVPEGEQCRLLKQGDTVFVERHAEAFESILSYYQTQQLHMPVTLCPSFYKQELAFWGVNPLDMATCCLQKYVTFFDDEEALQILEKDQTKRRLEKQRLMAMSVVGGWSGLQAGVWLALEEPLHSRAAKIYFAASTILVLTSILVLVAGTHEEFQRPLKVSEWKEYFGTEWETHKHHFEPTPSTKPETSAEPESTSEPETSAEPESTSEPETSPESESTSEPETSAEPESSSEPETSAEPETTSEPEAEGEPLPLPENAYARFDALEYIEYICVAVFSVDLIVRFVFCPFKCQLFVSFLYWVDIFALAVMYARYIVESYFPREKYEASILDILHCLQVIRVFRLFRLVKNFVGFRVLVYAFKASFREMLLMMLILMIATLLFSTFAYFSGDDNFPSIPDAMWWSIITMTTVGYGDIAPVLAITKVIGVMCALSGVCLIAVIIPILVNNFLLFYSYSKVWGKKHSDAEESGVKITQVQAADTKTKPNGMKAREVSLHNTAENRYVVG